MTAPRIPLLRFDAGWLFIVAGLAICISCALVSADRELQTLRVQQSLLHAEEQYAYARLRAHEDFLTQLDDPDEAFTRRLAAAELNLMPADEEPVLRLITYELPTVEWIDHTVDRPAPQPVLASDSKLTELATGQYRLWVFGAGIMCVFLGLLLDPGAASSRRRTEGSTDAAVDGGSEPTLYGGAVEVVREPIDASVQQGVDALETASTEEQVPGASSMTEEVDELIADAEDALAENEDADADEGVVDNDGPWDDDDEYREFVDEELEDEVSDDEPTVDLDADELRELSDEQALAAADVELADEVDATEDWDEDEAVRLCDEIEEHDEPTAEHVGVISIRPSMSVAPSAPDDDEVHDLFASVEEGDETWDDEESASEEVEAPVPTRGGKRVRKRSRS